MKLKDAKLLCLFKYGRLPRMGYEMKIAENQIYIGNQLYEITIWLAKEKGYKIKTFYHPIVFPLLSIAPLNYLTLRF